MCIYWWMNSVNIRLHGVTTNIIWVFYIHNGKKQGVVLCHLLENVSYFYTQTVVMLHTLGKCMTNVLMYLPKTNIKKKYIYNMIDVFLIVLNPIFLTFLFSYLYLYACHFNSCFFFEVMFEGLGWFYCLWIVNLQL